MFEGPDTTEVTTQLLPEIKPVGGLIRELTPKTILYLLEVISRVTNDGTNKSNLKLVLLEFEIPRETYDDWNKHIDAIRFAENRNLTTWRKAGGKAETKSNGQRRPRKKSHRVKDDKSDWVRGPNGRKFPPNETEIARITQVTRCRHFTGDQIRMILAIRDTKLYGQKGRFDARHRIHVDKMIKDLEEYKERADKEQTVESNSQDFPTEERKIAEFTQLEDRIFTRGKIMEIMAIRAKVPYGQKRVFDVRHKLKAMDISNFRACVRQAKRKPPEPPPDNLDYQTGALDGLYDTPPTPPIEKGESPLEFNDEDYPEIELPIRAHTKLREDGKSRTFPFAVAYAILKYRSLLEDEKIAAFDTRHHLNKSNIRSLNDRINRASYEQQEIFNDIGDDYMNVDPPKVSVPAIPTHPEEKKILAEDVFGPMLSVENGVHTNVNPENMVMLLEHLAFIKDKYGQDSVIIFCSRYKINMRQLSRWKELVVETNSSARNVFMALIIEGDDENFAPENDDEFKGTDAPAGSMKKLNKMAERVKRGCDIHHQDDRKGYDGLVGAVRPRT